MKKFMWLDQYGYQYWASNLKELKQAVCPYTRHPKVAIMYRDKKDGGVMRVGYIVSHHWLTKYELVEQPVNV